MKKFVLLAVALVLVVGAASASAITPAEVKVKKKIADTMTAEELAAYKVKLADRYNRGMFDNAPGGPSLAPADTCAAATPEISGLPYNSGSDTTVGQTDNYDLPSDVVAPTCTAAATCTGTGQAGSLPRGSIYTGTGTGPDRAYQFQTSANCELTLTLSTTTADQAMILYQANCTSSLTDCACVSDSGFAGDPETIQLSAVAGTVYYIVVDGYSTSAIPPGPSGAFSVAITGSGCTLTPVELEGFSVN
jgi:hypothetical protein